MVDLAALTSGPLADVDDPAPILSSETVFTGHVFGVDLETAEFGGGTIERSFTTHYGAVAVLPIDQDDRILLINQYRHPVRKRLWEIPAGLLDKPGEDPLAAAQRELAEEVDLIADEWSEPVLYYPSPGQSDELLRLYEARELHAAPSAFEREGEEAEIVRRWVTLDQAMEAVFSGRVGNSALIIGVLAAHARRS